MKKFLLCVILAPKILSGTPLFSRLPKWTMAVDRASAFLFPQVLLGRYQPAPEWSSPRDPTEKCLQRQL